MKSNMQGFDAKGAIPITPLAVRTRLEAIDVLRGLIMVIMALDHVRDFLHHDVLVFDPTDLRQTSGALFFTRWVTHFCAPVFFFLAGTGAFLGFRRGKTKGELARYLVTRGLWLILLEVTVGRCLGWAFNFKYDMTALLVLWALGWSMVFLAGLIYLPRWAIILFAVGMIGGHNLLDPIAPSWFGDSAWLWKILHAPGLLNPFPGMMLVAGYTLIPWVGVMAAGYAFGAIYTLDRAERRKLIIWLGAVLTGAFVLLRAINVYGNPFPWSKQETPFFTFLSFLNCTKYPPSLLYLLMTLGPALVLLGLLDRGLPTFVKPVVVFGRVPLFYYLLHVPLIHLVAICLSHLRYGRIPSGLLEGPPGIADLGKSYPADYGYGLLGVYAVWAFVVLALYPLCRWFADLKQRRNDVWLSYL